MKIFSRLNISILLLSFALVSCENNDKPVTEELDNKEQIENIIETPSEEHQIIDTIKVDSVDQNKTQTESIQINKSWIEKRDFINTDLGKALASDYKGDLMNDAAEDVAIQKNKRCGGEDCGKIVHLHNYNSEQKIRIAVEIQWKKDKETTRIKREYLVLPNSALDIGCTTDCSNTDKQKINWKIVGAEYAN